MEEKTIVGHITEIIDETNLVEIEEPHGNDDWKSHTLPQPVFDGHAEVELGEHVAVEVREYDRFTVAEARPLTKKEKQYLKQRFARADAKTERMLDRLSEDLFTAP